jgi:hypothetical protein
MFDVCTFLVCDLMNLYLYVKDVHLTQIINRHCSLTSEKKSNKDRKKKSFLNKLLCFEIELAICHLNLT